MLLHVSVNQNHHEGAYGVCLAKVTLLASKKIFRYWTVWSCGRILFSPAGMCKVHRHSLTLHCARCTYQQDWL